jgi:hypothetical protein
VTRSPWPSGRQSGSAFRPCHAAACSFHSWRSVAACSRLNFCPWSGKSRARLVEIEQNLLLQRSIARRKLKRCRRNRAFAKQIMPRRMQPKMKHVPRRDDQLLLPESLSTTSLPLKVVENAAILGHMGSGGSTPASGAVRQSRSGHCAVRGRRHCPQAKASEPRSAGNR